MKDLLEGIEFLGIPAIIGIILVGIYFLIDLKTKILPEVISLKKYFEKKKQKEADALKEQQEQKKILAEMQKSLTEMKTSVDKSLGEMKKSVDASIDEIKSHYTPEKLAQRDAWMEWVNSRAGVYDDSVEKLLLLQDKLSENNEITLGLYINFNRNRILDFARIVADDNALVSQEEFTRIYKVNKEYHNILTKYGKENGEVDTAMKLIDEAYDYRMRHHSFIEDVRGYTKR
jgi:hypothetical protein